MTKDLKRKGSKRSGGPRRPQCAFFFYIADRRASLREEQPGLKAMDTGRVLGDEWNKLTEEEKVPYQELAQKDRERYNEEKEELGLSE